MELCRRNQPREMSFLPFENMIKMLHYYVASKVEKEIYAYCSTKDNPSEILEGKNISLSHFALENGSLFQLERNHWKGLRLRPESDPFLL